MGKLVCYREDDIDRNKLMKLESLSIEDFRGLREVCVDFHPKVTVIVGKNGSGKTTVLEAVAAMLQPLRFLWPNERGDYEFHRPTVWSKDVRLGADDFLLRLVFSADALQSDFPRKIEYKDSDAVSNGVTPTIQALVSSVRDPEYVPPEKTLFVYYHQERGFKSGKTSQDVFGIDALQTNSLQADLRAINDLEEWWDKLDAQEARQVRDGDPEHRDPQLEAVRELIRSIDSFDGIFFSSTASAPGFYFKKTDGTSLHVSQLSSGERSYIILLADLARRLQVFDPKRTLDKIKGVVLIDEIELNLHPAWQSEVLPTLGGVFKNCQFVVTTHSPQVVSSMSSENVRILNKNHKGMMFVERPLNTKGRTSNYLLEGVFDADERFPQTSQLIERFNQAIDATDLENAKKLIAEITSNIEGQAPDLIVLKKRLKKLESRL